ncbi:MAG: hypothetical protein A2744_02190 [Candidatus Buchananbacteria bacterium RIFCSPHIGHO2_01_FULL_44_11]|uniref:Glycosyltransferase RgtA/B/C/D-like domain-containing protein n=1 Tax=Candidatus Buchananbacteria bacterium RIFCSPHIGHO2_01_FULL_44_11 TaxID=1797535 RepID=A0A1G1XZG0_9BACT|nr:MAG: hypothetical protein A2744_02190 [Candidatus Buchananbacteria bacterium RIFCSPHIGHO2_01_FULL_44_11]
MPEERLKFFSPVDRLAYAAFFLIFIGAFLFVRPFGEFPLIDDWVHSLTIHSYLADGDFFYSPLLASFLHVPILYGIGLGKLFGFSFFLLRLSNLILGFFTVIIFYRFLRHLKNPPPASFLLSLLLWFNPIFFSLSHTFMSDVPALFFLVTALFFYHRGFKENNNWFIFFASSLTVFGFYTRQFVGLLLFIAAGYWLWQNRHGWRPAIWLFGLPIAILFGVYGGLSYFNLLPLSIGAVILPSALSVWQHYLLNFWGHGLFISLFLLPVSFSVMVNNRQWLKDKVLILLLLISLAITAILHFNHHTFLDLGSIINWWGLGPSFGFLQGQINAWGGRNVYLIINFILGAALPFNIFLAAKTFKTIEKNQVTAWIFLVFGELYFLFILPLSSFDRYLLLLLPSLLIFAGFILQHCRWSKTVFTIFLIPFLFYSLIGTYNYLAWNQARWTAADRLVKEKNIAAHRIDAGVEWDGWALGASEKNQFYSGRSPEWTPWYIQTIFRGQPMDYIVAFSEIPGYNVIDRQKVNGLMSNIDYLYVNQKP